MAKPILSLPHFCNEEAAFSYAEAHLWPKGPVCPHCGNTNAERIGKLTVRSKPTKRSPEGAIRHGLRKCYATGCRKEFTVRVGTIFEDSHLPLHLWLQAIHLLSSGKKGISSRHIQRLLNCSMKTAWFLTHRIREIMGAGDKDVSPLGGEGKTIEGDETYLGNKRNRAIKAGAGHKRAVFSLVERGGKARSFYVEHVTREALDKIATKHADKASILNTDEALRYVRMGKRFKAHEVINHSNGEYARGTTTTNSVEGFFAVLKRGMYGTYQHVSEAHLHRYLREFDFRFSHREKLGFDDTTRAGIALRNAKGRRLTYDKVGGA